MQKQAALRLVGGLAPLTDVTALWRHLVAVPLEAPEVCEAACMAVADVAKVGSYSEEKR